MADTTSASALRTITRNRFIRPICDPTELPFVKNVKTTGRTTTRKFWHFPEISCYATANIVGAQYAADFIQYLKENPDMAGALLHSIVKEMYLSGSDKGQNCGIAVSFMGLIEKAIIQSPIDHYKSAEATARIINSWLDEDASDV